MARDYDDFASEDQFVERDLHMGGVAMNRRGFKHGFGGNEGKDFSGKGPKGWKRNDETIREEACEALYRSYDVDASEVEVEVKDCTVTLKGIVENREMKRAAEDAVSDVTGVEDVMNKLSLRHKEEHMNRRMSTPEADPKGRNARLA